ncbi:hypothetical protein WIW50_10120 [Flavobacteriaceae bacterium 3-367]
MKNIHLFREEVLTRTLSLVDEPYEKWRTYNYQINTKLFFANEDINGSFNLNNGELPLLECKLEDSYVLITTDRIISILDSEMDQISIQDIDHFGNEFEKENFKIVEGKGPKTNTILLVASKGDKLKFKIDSLYPAYFAKILIHNLINIKNKGTYSWG